MPALVRGLAAFETQLQTPVPELNERPVLAEPDPKAWAVGDPLISVHRLEAQGDPRINVGGLVG